jgi:hypothetical protein
MRRIDAIGIALGIFLAGGLAYVGFQLFGFNSQDAGIWSQAVLVVGLIGWLSTYLFRAGTKNMTYHQQREEYEKAFLQKKLDELSPEELAKLQADIESEK